MGLVGGLYLLAGLLELCGAKVPDEVELERLEKEVGRCLLELVYFFGELGVKVRGRGGEGKECGDGLDPLVALTRL